MVFHGPHRDKLTSGLFDHDVVITTYDTLRSEWSSGPQNSVLFSNPEGWARVVLDEGEPATMLKMLRCESLTNYSKIQHITSALIRRKSSRLHVKFTLGIDGVLQGPRFRTGWMTMQHLFPLLE